MRRFLLLCMSLLAIIVTARAEKVSPQQAAAVAERFLAAEFPATKSTQGTIHLTGTWPQVQTKGAAEEPALYLFERDGGGYVVVAGDDVSLPVIGYSTSGRLSLDKLPANLRFMLDWHASMIAYARTHGLQADAATKAQWLSAGNTGDAVLLETAHWNQENGPYDDLIPKVKGKDCPAGCVATAMAIILRYYCWPERGTGTLPAYDYAWDAETGTYLGHIDDYPLGHAYDWSQMPLKYEKGKYTAEQAAQVARLTYDLAVMSKMDFYPSPIGSGAEGDSPIKLAKYFGYDKQIRYEEWDYFKKDVWEDKIRAEINAGRPVFYGGISSYGEGHAFVVDGYKGPYFSLNYGWGYGSEYYLLRPSVSLDPDAVTAFCQMACMVSHIYPDRGGEVFFNWLDKNLVPFPWDFRSKSFPVGGRNIDYFVSPEDVATWLGFVLYDREGRFKAMTSDTVRVSTENMYIPELTCNITCAIEEGDCLMLSQRVNGQWAPVQQNGSACLTFHPGQKISELVSVGYSVGDPDDGDMDDAPCFFLRGVKEIYWEVWSEDLGALLATSKSAHAVAEYGGQVYTMSAHWDKTEEDYRSVFHYPAGTYRILLRNFDEEITLHVKL